MKTISITAGPQALKIIREEGLKSDSVDIIAGAAGGPKWLILGGIDRFIFGGWFNGRKRPLYLAGSSIGTWRFAAAATPDPLKSIQTFEDAYISQSYSASPSPREVSQEGWRILNAYLDDGAVDHALTHPYIRLCIFTVRSRGPFAIEDNKVLLPAFGGLFLLNAVNRGMLATSLKRTLFTDRRNLPPFYPLTDLRADRVTLTPENFKSALLASGSIPLVMEGVRDIPGAVPGVYRDGGLVDYQMDIPFGVRSDRLVLYPHFSGQVIPGWLDKQLPWRRASKNLENVVLVYPSDELIKKLPAGKIPDRTDFKRWDDMDRIANWRICAQAAKVMGDEFAELVVSGRIREEVRAL